MMTVAPGDRVSDGDRVGRVEYIIPGERRGLNGGAPTEARVLWDNGEWSFECLDDLLPEPTSESGLKG